MKVSLDLDIAQRARDIIHERALVWRRLYQFSESQEQSRKLLDEAAKGEAECRRVCAEIGDAIAEARNAGSKTTGSVHSDGASHEVL